MGWKEHPDLNLLIPNIVRPRQYSKKQPCVYCGGPNESKDHVVPKGIYREVDKVEIKRLFTVGACLDCNNNKKSALDTFLRDCLVVDIDVCKHPIAKEIFESEFMRAMVAGSTRTFEHFRSGHTVRVPNLHGSGEELGWAIEIDDQSLLGAIRYVTQGLHFGVFNETVKHEDVSVYLIPREDRQDRMQSSARLMLFQGYFEQGPQFRSAYGQDTAGRVIWHHIFFGTMLFVAFSQGSVPVSA